MRGVRGPRRGHLTMARWGQRIVPADGLSTVSQSHRLPSHGYAFHRARTLLPSQPTSCSAPPYTHPAMVRCELRERRASNHARRTCRRSPDGAERNPGSLESWTRSLDFAAVLPPRRRRSGAAPPTSSPGLTGGSTGAVHIPHRFELRRVVPRSSRGMTWRVGTWAHLPKIFPLSEPPVDCSPSRSLKGRLPVAISRWSGCGVRGCPLGRRLG